jgi:hypothetical protein
MHRVALPGVIPQFNSVTRLDDIALAKLVSLDQRVWGVDRIVLEGLACAALCTVGACTGWPRRCRAGIDRNDLRFGGSSV